MNRKQAYVPRSYTQTIAQTLQEAGLASEQELVDMQHYLNTQELLEVL